MTEPPVRNLETEFDGQTPQTAGMHIPIVETPGAGGESSNAVVSMLQLLHQMMKASQQPPEATSGPGDKIVIPARERTRATRADDQSSPTGSERICKAKASRRSEEGGTESEAESKDENTPVVNNMRRKIRKLEEQLRDKEEGGRKEARVGKPTWYEEEGESLVGKTRLTQSDLGRNNTHTRGNPFSPEILQDPLPPHFKPVNYEYDGMTDPEEHVSRFENVALLHQYTEGVKCRVFATTLVGLAQQWFKQLSPQSIFSFEDFYDVFTRQFASARRSAKSSLYLMTVKQEAGESLRDYVSKFNMIALETPGADARIKIHAFVQGLKSGPFFDSLVMDDPADFSDLLRRITPFIHLEEAKMARMTEVERGRAKKQDEGRPAGRGGGTSFRPTQRFEDRPQPFRHPLRDYQSASQYRSPIPVEGVEEITLTRPMSAIMEIAQKVPGWTAPPSSRGPPRGEPSPIFCKFHNQFGHDTDRCRNLKLVIERLIREGKLLEFVRKENGDRHPGRREHGGSTRGMARPPLPLPPPPPLPPKPRIHMIMGGEKEAMSNRARKATVRAARQVTANVMEIRKEGNPEGLVEFNSLDERPMIRPHNDALVIVADIADFLVSRTFVDTGSSVNIIFRDCLEQMSIGEVLRPPAGMLYGFSGESVSPLGLVDLTVTLGSPGANVKKLIEFVVLDLPSSAYNVILGRPALNIFKAVVSTYYLKMKFPVEGGVGEAWGSQTSSRECYVKAITQSNKRKGANPLPMTEDKKPRKEIEEEIETVLDTEKRPQMEPAEQVLTIELYPGKMGFTTKIGAGMDAHIETGIIACLRRNADVFAFRPADLKGVDPAIAVHKLNEDPRVRPVKQRLRQFGAEKDDIIKEEVRKLLEAGHIVEIQFPIWLSNAVLVGKGEGKWRMCIDFRDLNKACPKDHYPLPRIDQLVDATSGCELLSMMDAYQGYHQVRMHPDDVAKAAFRVCCGVYGYVRMPFGLKNAGATYQRMMDYIFKKQIGRNMAVYVDDMLVKSLQAGQHETDLEEVFKVVRANGLMLNPAKCAFGVRAGKFLGYMVTPRGIEVNSAKTEALMAMTPPRSIKEVQRLNGRITALSRFISRTADKSLPFFKILRRKGKFDWDGDCQDAFEQLKTHLATLPLLTKPVPGDVLIVYLAIGDSALSTVLLKEEGEHQKPIYFVSKILQGPEARYSEIEKAALAIMITARKLRPYFLSHKVVVRTMFPFKQVLGRPDLSGRMVKWAVELGEYDVEFLPRTAVKAQALVDFIVESTRAPEPPAWVVWVDGSVTKDRSGAGILIVTPEGSRCQFAIQFDCPLSNNEAEYEAVVRALKMLITMGAEKVIMNTDSQLIAQQILGNYEVKEGRMGQYLRQVRELVGKTSTFEIKQIPREENEEANRLARVASSVGQAWDGEITLLRAESKSISEEVCVIADVMDWRTEIIHYLQTGESKESPSKMASKCAKYFLLDGKLYRRGFNNPHLRCLSKEEGRHMLNEIHSGCCGNHSGYRDLVRKTVRAGFYWPNIIDEAKNLVKTCDSCQRHAPLIHVPGEKMGAMFSSCPFDKWGIDIVGKLPTAPGGKVFLIVAVDYFSKWVEAEAVVKVDDTTIQRFLWKNICCRYGVPRILISDNGTQFTSARIQAWCEDMGITQRFVSVAHPQANGQVEVTNRTISDGLKKRLEKSKGKWAEELDTVLWAYRTSPRTATGESPFTLVYGSNAVIPAEITMESYRIQTYDEVQNAAVRRDELDMVDIKRETAHVRAEKYKSQVRASYNKHVRIRRLEKGDLVLKRADAIKPLTKFEANWEGPFLITEVLGGGAYHLADMEGRPLTRPWNINKLKKYYV